jgi:O-acetyl-ADP-ribose deacetylase (regulator of RNase III)
MKILVGDILQSKAQTLINTVNCVGVMGKGIALEFKKRFPEMFDDYEKRCERKEVSSP